MRFQSLDALRGFAAIVVAIFHFSSGWAGYLAVDFFLVLSGFVLSHGYLYGKKNTSFSEFLSHRLARLYPLHLFTLFTFIAVFYSTRGSFPHSEDGTWFTFLQNLVLLQNVGLNPSGLTYNYPSWSISVELWVNIAFFLFISTKTSTWKLILASVVGLSAIWAGTGHLDTHAANYIGFVNSGLVRGMSSFLLGIVAYRIYRRITDTQRLEGTFNLKELLCILLVVVTVFLRDSKTSQLDFAAPFVFTIIVVVFAFEKGYLSVLLRKFSYLGDISYSIYLNHVTVLLIAHYLQKEFELPSIVVLGGYIAALLVYSHFTYQSIEKPLRSRGRNLLLKVKNRVGFATQKQ